MIGLGGCAEFVFTTKSTKPGWRVKEAGVGAGVEDSPRSARRARSLGGGLRRLGWELGGVFHEEIKDAKTVKARNV